MFKKFAAPLIIVTAASVGFFACSSDSSTSGPNVGDEFPTSSSSQIAANSSSSISTSLSAGSSSRKDVESSSSANVIPSSSSDNSTSSSTESNSSSSRIATSSSSSLRLSSANLSSSSIDAPLSSSNESPYFWNDEFDGEAIDTSKWMFEIGTGSNGWGNNEKEYYTSRKDNAYIKDGVLHICAKKEDYEGQKYTSARMITKGKFAFKYGTVEARIALPTGKGIWPAFWMLGENFDTVGWPACGEIDIIESINDESIVYGTHHWQYDEIGRAHV